MKSLPVIFFSLHGAIRLSPAANDWCVEAVNMAPMSQEDLEWFKSTFRPIPKPELPDDCVEYSLYHIPSNPTPAIIDGVAETRLRLVEVQRTAAELTRDLLKDYIWQREGFRLEISKGNGTLIVSLQICRQNTGSG
jgi:hypothetical protein